MRTTKVYRATLRKDLNEDNKKGKTLKLEFELNNKVSVLSNTEWDWYLDTITVDDVDNMFENLTFLKTNTWREL